MQPALLVIDAQQEYFRPHGRWVVTGGEEALAQIETLLAAFRGEGLPVFHIVHEALDPQSPVFRAGSEGQKMHPALSVQPGEHLIKKHFPGSFTETPLAAYLRRAGVDTPFITGFMTHVCCDTTTRQAAERGLHPVFVSDATATRGRPFAGEIVPAPDIQRATCAAMGDFAEVLATQDAILRLRS
ncbi:MAG: cysteine hydrolase family protein [Thermaerobacter sp.]|nr:cysteine hydrolase family protein [Thermaerobacter sp.]